MAAKTSLANPDHAATTLLAQLPASLAPSSPLLAASLPLLPNPLVSYSVYAPASAASDVLHTLDDARRRILAFPIVQHGPDRLAPPPLRDALLPYTHVALGLLYVFALGTTDGPTPSTTALASLSASLPPSLVLRDTGTFTPQDLYPCSPACAPQRMPCPACLNPPLAHALPRYPSPPASPSRPRRAGSGPRLPREPLRLPYALFLDALRARLLDDVVRVSACSTDPSEPPVKRLGAGFLLGPSPATSRWSDGWQHHAQSRPLIYCHLHLHLHATHISIHPLLRPTPYLPLPLFLSPSPPSTSHGRPASLRPGAPIVLLPFHTPAHFLAPYPASSSPSPSSSQTSPSASALSSLTRQFTASLAGLGAGDWTSPPPYLSPPTRTSPFSASASASHPDPSSVPTSDTHTDRDRDRDRDRDKDKHATPTYIIAWLPLDPDRGLPIVWPARLSLAFSPSSPITSSSPSSSTPPPPPPLSHIPALAPQLQPSPPPPAPSLPLPLSLAHLARLSSASASAPSSAAPSPTTAGAAAGPIASLVARSLSRSTTPGPGPGPSSATALGPVPGGGGGVGAGTGGGGVGVGAGTGVGGGAGGGPGSRPPSRGPFAYHPPASPTRAAAAFRALTLAQDAPPGRSRTTRERRERTATRTRGGSGIRARAVEVAVYTDAVAKERERERERMRREREREREREGGAGSSKAEADKEEDVGAVGVGSSSSPPPLALAQPIGVGVGEGRGAAMDGAGGGFAEGGGGGQVREGGGEQAAVQDAGMAPPSTADVPPVPDSIGAPAAPPAPAPTSYDFALEGWGSAAGDDYMDFDFAMDMDAIASGGAPHDIPTVAANMDVDMGVGVDFEEMFTEDDFSFFDKPSTAAAAATSTTTSAVTALAAPLTASTTLAEHGLPIFGSGLTPAAGPAPLGLSPPFADPPWPAPTPADAFEPPAPPPPPELVPPSSRDTPSSAASPAPATPAVHVAASPGGGASPFDPIPFAPTHRQADGKYLLGKFALPVLGKEPVLGEEDVVLPLSPKSAAAEGWRLRYAAATDPRVGVIKQLIGVKRKAQGARAADKASPSWLRNDEEWLDSTAYGDEDARDDEADAGSSTSGSSSDSDSPEEDAGAGEDERIVPDGPSRPTTPPPPYLPAGPTLLATRFHPGALLPLSQPLRAPGTVPAPAPAPALAPSPPAPLSAPTPVSPAALAGAATERGKTLEAAAQMLAREVVENAAWRPADPARAFAPRGAGAEVWPVDAVRAARALKGVTGVTGELAVRDLFEGAGEHAPLEQPRIAVGKGDAVVQMLPSALRFWDKLGLTPRGGPKDVVAFVLYEEREPGREEQMGRWLEMVSQLYSGKSFGAHRPGTHKSCSRDGLLPFKFDAIRRTLPPLVGSMNVADSFVVFYVAVPPAYHSLDLPVLRHIFSAMKRAARADGRVLFQLVPEHAIFDALDHHAAKRLHLDALVHSVYDRIQTPVQRTMARAIFKTRDPSWIEIPIEDPAFALARPRNEVVKFVRDAPPRSLDVLDRHTFLHVGYRLSACGRWLLAACVDQRGEAHDVGVWLTPGDNVETQIVSQLWSFAVEFGRRANVEWRLVFCKLGPLGAPELDAWVNHLQNVVPACTELPMVHVTLLCADLDCGWTLLPADARRKPMARASTNDASEGVYVDVSESTYFITQSEVTPILPPPLADSPALLGAQHAFVPDSSLDATGTASAGPPPSPSPSASLLASDELGLLPLATTALLQISPARTTMLSAHRFYSIASSASTCTVPDAQTHEDSTRNWYELSVLARARQQLHAHPALPLHLAALEVMREAFEVAGSPTE